MQWIHFFLVNSFFRERRPKPPPKDSSSDSDSSSDEDSSDSDDLDSSDDSSDDEVTRIEWNLNPPQWTLETIPRTWRWRIRGEAMKEEDWEEKRG